MKRGFALVELITVAVMIAAAAALLLPVLSGARERARGAVCLNNMSQVGVAAGMYAGDYGGHVVIYSGGWQAHVPTVRIFYDEGYMRRMDSWVCPSIAPYRWEAELEPSDWPSYSEVMQAHYAVPRVGGHLPRIYEDAVALADRDDRDSEAYVDTAGIDSLSAAPLLSEYTRFSEEVKQYGGNWVRSHRHTALHFRRVGTTNVGFLDGRAESFGPQQIRGLDIVDRVLTQDLEHVDLEALID